MSNLVFVLFCIVYVYWVSGFRVLMSAYKPKRREGFKGVGFFYFFRDRFGFVGGIVNIAVSSDGILIFPVFPLWFRAAFVPWEDVWLEEVSNPLRPTTKIGFLGCPSRNFHVTALFREQVRRASGVVL